MFFDQYGLPVDETGDGMDSAMRAGILEVFGGKEFTVAYELYPGSIVRHPMAPVGKPQTNPKNVTRDQLIVKLAGYAKTGRQDICKRVFLELKRNGFRAPNTERDMPGSVKMRCPHEFYKDSNPNEITLPLKFNFLKFKFESQLTQVGYEIERKMYDAPDLLMPDHVYHFIKCAGLEGYYFSKVMGVAWLALSILGHSLSSHKEHNQIACQVKIAGNWAVGLFKLLTPSWKEDLRKYWGSRNESKYAELIIEGLA